jgi:hypothetical protein
VCVTPLPKQAQIAGPSAAAPAKVFGRLSNAAIAGGTTIGARKKKTVGERTSTVGGATKKKSGECRRSASILTLGTTLPLKSTPAPTLSARQEEETPLTPREIAEPTCSSAAPIAEEGEGGRVGLVDGKRLFDFENQ